MNTPLILVVDDEEQVGMLAALFLKRAGYRTIRASTVQEALEVFTDEIDLLLTDWAMPDMSGDELAAQLLERKGSLRVVFMSGNAVSSLAGVVALEPGINFIQKPFGSNELLTLVARALGDEVTASR